MANLTTTDKRKLEKIFKMESGYVLEFTNRTFSEFIYENIGIEIYDEKYNYGSGSKANLLRGLWKKQSNYNTGRLIKALLTYWKDERIINHLEVSKAEQLLYEDCLLIGERLISASTVKEIDAIDNNTDDRDFNRLAESIQQSIEKDEPEIALDRLHTYLFKLIRKLCTKWDIEFRREESLNAMYGKYIRYLMTKGHIESKMTEKILKYSINLLDAFNDIRNNRSLAHDNPVLNYSESLLIFNNITNSIKFIETIEDELDEDKKKGSATSN